MTGLLGPASLLVSFQPTYVLLSYLLWHFESQSQGQSVKQVGLVVLNKSCPTPHTKTMTLYLCQFGVNNHISNWKFIVHSNFGLRIFFIIFFNTFFHAILSFTFLSFRQSWRIHDAFFLESVSPITKQIGYFRTWTKQLGRNTGLFKNITKLNELW